MTKKQNDPLDDMTRMVKRAKNFAARVLQKSKGADIQIKDVTEASQLLQAIAGLSRAVANLEKVRLERDGAIRMALKVLSEDCRARLEQKPKLWVALQKELYAAKDDRVAKLKENPRASLPNKNQILLANQLDDENDLDQ